MFGHGIRLPFKLLGIPIILDWSFLLILLILAWMIGANVPESAVAMGLGDADELGQGWMPYAMGLMAGIGLYLSVLLHELGHAIVARMYGVKVKSITLWFLGGVAQFEEMPRQRGAEAVVAIIGPIVSVLIGVACGILFFITTGLTPALRFVLGYLAVVNIALAIFNLIPALPLDGGRVLRSLLALKLTHAKATQVAGTLSKGLAVVLGMVGLFGFNPWLIFIALFVYMAGSAETQSTRIEELLHGMPVGELMNREVQTVPPDLTVAELTETMLRERHLGFPVVEDGTVLGIVTLHDAEGKDPHLRVADIMTPKVATVNEDADANAAFREMSRNNFSRLVVVGPGGRMVGIITKTDLMRAMQLRSVNEDLAVPERSPTRGAQFRPYHSPT